MTSTEEEANGLDSLYNDAVCLQHNVLANLYFLQCTYNWALETSLVGHAV